MQSNQSSSVPTQRPVGGAIKGALIVLLAMAVGPSHLHGQSSLGLSIYLGKAEYFEGEPIYVVFRLRNTSTGDTAWVQPFQLMPDKLSCALKRSNGAIVPHEVFWIDYVTDATYRGMPVAPGADLFRVVVLQESWGAEPKSSERVFLHHLAPDRYTLFAQFDPRVPKPGSPTQEAIVAEAVSFTVRPRTQAEEIAFHEVQDVMGLVWDRAQRPHFVPALIALAGRRLAADDTDPYLAYLLNHGVVMAEAAQVRLDSTQYARVMTLRIATARTQRALPAGALVAQAVSLASRGTGLHLSDTLGPSLAGDVVRVDEASYLKGMAAWCERTNSQSRICKR